MSTGRLGRLERVELRAVWGNEAGDFTPWLATEENIALLGEAIGLELEVEAQEKQVGPYRADILCKETSNGNWVLIENQLEKTNHTHLGQLLTYASGLKAVTVVWIAQRFTDEHRSVLDWLNEITDDDFTFFGLEIELWRIGNSDLAPKFNIVSQPNDVTRTITDVTRDPSLLTDTKRLQLDYWTQFRERLADRAPTIRGTRPRPQHWNNFSIGRTDFGLVTFVNTREQRIGIILVLKGPYAKQHFQLLNAERAIIEKELGEALEWRPMPEKKESRITLFKIDVDLSQLEQWPTQHEWLADKLIAFDRVFRQRVKNLDSTNAEADGEDSDEDDCADAEVTLP